jgi:hypothetical protein
MPKIPAIITGTMFFITSVGCMMPMEAMPTPALAVPYAAPRSARRAGAGGEDGRLAAGSEVATRAALQRHTSGAARQAAPRPRAAIGRAAQPAGARRAAPTAATQPAHRGGCGLQPHFSHSCANVLAKTRALLTPMKPKKAALDGHKSTVVCRRTLILRDCFSAARVVRSVRPKLARPTARNL